MLRMPAGWKPSARPARCRRHEDLPADSRRGTLLQPTAVAGLLRRPMRHRRFLLPQQIYRTVRIRSRGYLPHWESPEGTYFVTFRLADSLPESTRQRIRQEREALRRLLTRNDRPLTAIQSDQLGQFAFARTDEALDLGCGACWMRRPEVAAIVSASLQFFDKSRYRLHAWCVMPNHVHVLFTIGPTEKLDRILHSWKSFTATKSNEIIGMSGSPFWEHESYDRLVRSAEEFANVRRYILSNPQKAGLPEWPWVGAEDEGFC